MKSYISCVEKLIIKTIHVSWILLYCDIKENLDKYCPIREYREYRLLYNSSNILRTLFDLGFELYLVCNMSKILLIFIENLIDKTP